MKYLWIITFCTFPLLATNYLRFSSLTLFAILSLGTAFFGILFKKKLIFESKYNLYVALFLLLFAILQIIDTTRTHNISRTFFESLKTLFNIAFLLSFSLFFKKSYTDAVLKTIVLSSGVFLCVFIYNSIINLDCIWFSINLGLCTEDGKNQLAFYLTAITPLSFWMMYNQQMKAMWFSLFMLHLAALYYTLSRGALVCTILSFIFIGLLYLIVKRKVQFRAVIKSTVALLIAIAIVIYSQFDLYIRRTLEKSSQEFHSLLVSLTQTDIHERSTNLRFSFIKDAIFHFYQSPIFGIGENNFEALHHYPTHNSYLQILAEHGLIGFLILMTILYITLIYLCRKNMSLVQLALLHSFIATTLYLNLINAWGSLVFIVIIAFLNLSKSAGTLKGQYKITNI